MENIYIGDIISTLFILFILVIMIVASVSMLKMVVAKAKQPASQSDSAIVQQVYELTIRMNTLEQQMEELKKKSL